MARLDCAINEPGSGPWMAGAGADSPTIHLETDMNHVITIILTTTLAAWSQITQAANPSHDAAHHVEVHFADLNLGSAGGASVLYRRLQKAANQVCDEVNTKDPGSASRLRACVSKAISAAVAQIDRPALTAYYRARHRDANRSLRQASL
jgi:UrcA family protein